MSKKKSNIPEELLAFYDNLFDGNSEIERKGVTLPYTAVNGNMFTFISNEGELSIRLSEQDRETFIRKYKTRLSVQHGIIMKEYVLVPELLLKKTRELLLYIEKSFNYTKSLRPKKKIILHSLTRRHKGTKVLQKNSNWRR